MLTEIIVKRDLDKVPALVLLFKVDMVITEKFRQDTYP
jgi:hypothetical protein